MDSGVYHGITQEVLIPKLQELLDIPDDKIFHWNLYTTSDFKMFCNDKRHTKKAGAGMNPDYIPIMAIEHDDYPDNVPITHRL